MSVTAVPLHPISKGSVAKLLIGLFVLAALAVAFAWAGTKGHGYTTTASGLQYRVVKQGEGPHPTTADVALVDYTGRLESGKVFDTSIGKQPVPLPLSGGIIPGFAEALQLMNKGASYEFRMPPNLAYGATGQGEIPPNSTLDFEITLLEFIPAAALQGMMGPQGPGAPQGAPPAPR